MLEVAAHSVVHVSKMLQLSTERTLSRVAQAVKLGKLSFEVMVCTCAANVELMCKTEGLPAHFCLRLSSRF